MPVPGVSTGKGVDRLLDITPSQGDLLLHIHERPDNNREKIVVDEQAFLAAAADQTRSDG